MAKQKVTFNEALGVQSRGGELDVVECLAVNVGQVAKDLKEEVEVDGEYIKLTWKTGIALIQLLWNAVKKTVFDCFGKQIKVEIGGWLGDLVRFALTFLGLKL